jgi:TolB protein
MNKLYLFLFSLLSFTGLLCADDTLEIALATETVAEPLAVLAAQELTPGARALTAVLQNDLRLSGWFQLVRAELSLQEISAHDPFSHPKLRQNSAMHYLVTIEEQPAELAIKVYDLQKKTLIRLKPQDHESWRQDARKAAHLLSNEIIKATTGHTGIAHCKVLYAVNQSHSTSSPSEIWMCDYDGYNARRVFQSSALAVSPSFIPGRGLSEFCYVSYKLGQPKLMWGKIGAGSQRISALGGNQLTPCFDARALQLAFVSDSMGNPDIFLMKINPSTGKALSTQKLFASAKGTQASPTFNPDGTQLALVSSKDGSPRVYIIRIEDFLRGEKVEKAKLISKKNRESTAPAWSPDGRFIAYSACNQGVRQIWIYDCQNGQETCITQGEGSKENPSWAPDSLHLYFDQEETAGCSIYMIDLNLQKPQRIGQGGRIQRFPSCSR